MPLDLTGITNHHEYHSQHYLLALFEGDLQDILVRWDAAAADHPDSEAVARHRFRSADLTHATRYVEVKSRSGPWSGPVALSREQFLKAQSEGDRFWLYVVEHTRDPAATRLHRIQDPAGKSRHFTFDPGWSALAELGPNEAAV